MKIITSDKIKTTGFLKLNRELNGFLFAEDLSTDEFGLLLIFAMNADWDTRHRNFGRVCISNKTLGKIRGLNRNKAANLKKSLESKGFIKKHETENGVDIIEVIGFEKFQPNPNLGYAGIVKSLESESNKPFTSD